MYMNRKKAVVVLIDPERVPGLKETVKAIGGEVLEKAYATVVHVQDPSDSTISQEMMLVSERKLPKSDELYKELKQYVEELDPEGDTWDYDDLWGYLYKRYGEEALSELVCADWRRVYI